MTTCPNGHENPGNQGFCGECGARLRTADTPASAELERVEQQGYRPFIIAAIAASVGVMVGSIGQWVTAGMFSVDGLDSGKWGTIALILGAVSCVVMLIEFVWPRTAFDPRWAVPLAWAVAVAGVACVTYAVPFLIRVMTLPKARFFGVPFGAEVGWGLWLLALSSAVMCVAASIVATQIARSVDVRQPLRRSNASWTAGWRWAAIVASALVAISGLAYYSVNWGGSSGGIGASPTAMPSFPSLPSFPSFPSFPSSSTLSSAPTSSAPAQPTDYTGLLIQATDIDAPPPITFTGSPPTSNSNGLPGVATAFSTQDGNHVIKDSIQVFADPAAAMNALNAAKGAQAGAIKDPATEAAKVGADGTTLTGNAPDGSHGVAILLFTEGNAFVTLEFDGPADSLPPPEFVTDIGQKQDDAVKKGLGG